MLAVVGLVIYAIGWLISTLAYAFFIFWSIQLISVLTPNPYKKTTMLIGFVISMVAGSFFTRIEIIWSGAGGAVPEVKNIPTSDELFTPFALGLVLMILFLWINTKKTNKFRKAKKERLSAQQSKIK